MKRKLNITIVKNAKPKPDGKLKKYADGGGLHLLVSQKGKYWRYNYKFNDKFKTLALGVYPDVSLKDARLVHEDARELLIRDIDPTAYKKTNKATKAHLDNTSFEGVGCECYIMWKDDNIEAHAKRTLTRLENDVFPWMGERLIEEIEPPEILMVLRRIESRGALETAHRVWQVIGQVFRYAVAMGRAQRDQTFDLRGALKPYRKNTFRLSLTLLK